MILPIEECGAEKVSWGTFLAYVIFYIYLGKCKMSCSYVISIIQFILIWFIVSSFSDFSFPDTLVC